MVKTIRVFTVFLLVVLSLVFTHHQIYSQDDDLDKKRQEIEQLQQELEKVRGQKQTLAKTLEYLNGQIKLTQKQIDETTSQLKLVTDQIQDLNTQITSINTNLEQITKLLVHRVTTAYKNGRTNPVLALISSQDLSHLLTQYKYVKTTQRNDRRLLYQLEATKTDYTHQKTAKEDKQLELDQITDKLTKQKNQLAKQEKDKKAIYEITKNDEKKFQAELATKQAEIEAIQSIIAGKGQETEVGKIDQGARIASVISGPSTCSSGAHLHLEVAKDGFHRNPAEYLSSKSVVWDNAPDGPFSFNGSWAWPLNDPVRVTQGYGMTFYAATMRYYGGAPHTGIDMINNQDFTVKAVKSGQLYRGAIACRGGSLRYVRVKHDDGVSSYYLHVNY